MRANTQLVSEELRAKKAAAIKAWRMKNAEHVKAYSKQYKSSNEAYRERKRDSDRNRYHEVYKHSAEYRARAAKINKAWASLNPDKAAEKARRWAANNKASINAKQRERWQSLTEEERRSIYAARREYQNNYRKENAEKLSEYSRCRREENLDADRANQRTRYAKDRDAYIARAEERQRKLSERGKYTAEDVQALYVKQCGRCAGCNLEIENTRSRSAKRGFEVDHVMPVKLGGSNLPENLQLLCRPCNRKKHAKHHDEWARIAANLRLKNTLCLD
jgi:5-methylcytosine-specific restriction endonuclease McrA